MTSQLPLDPAVIDRLWERAIRPDVFEECQPTPQPQLTLIGGQPGAGKTRASELVISELLTNRPVQIAGDDFRQYHPDYQWLLEHDPLQMPHVTAPAAAAWTERAIEHAFTERYSALVEGTWRNSAVPMTTARHAREHGFGVHAVVVAVHPVLSRLSTVERYYRHVDAGQPARWTPTEAHEQAITALVDTAREVGASPAVTRTSIIDRAAAQRFDSSDTVSLELRGRAFADSLELSMQTPLTSDEARAWLTQAEALHQAHQRHTLTVPEAQDLWNRIWDVDRQLVLQYLDTAEVFGQQELIQRSFGTAATGATTGAGRTGGTKRPGHRTGQAQGGGMER